MTKRYWVVVTSLLVWTALAVPTWWHTPTGYTALLGHPDSRPLLVFGVFSFVIVGTLYHVIPFIIWLECYSDRLGFERVPMIDDLYSSRVERAEFRVTLVGFLGLATASLVSAPVWVSAVSGLLVTIGFTLFVSNLLSTIHRHGPGGLGGLVSTTTERDPGEETKRSGKESLE